MIQGSSWRVPLLEERQKVSQHAGNSFLINFWKRIVVIQVSERSPCQCLGLPYQILDLVFSSCGCALLVWNWEDFSWIRVVENLVEDSIDPHQHPRCQKKMFRVRSRGMCEVINLDIGINFWCAYSLKHKHVLPTFISISSLFAELTQQLAIVYV